MAKSSGIILTGKDGWAQQDQQARKRKRYVQSFGGNRLIPTATQNTDRELVPLLDFDVHRNVTTYGRRIMQSLGKRLVCGCDVVRGMVDEVSEIASSSFLQEYRGESPEFKNEVEDWSYWHDKRLDIAGPPYDARSLRDLVTRAQFVEGDIGGIFCTDELGEPRVQLIPSHRIGSDSCELFVTASNIPEFIGRRIIEGVIVGDQMQPLGYRVLTGDSCDWESFVDVPEGVMKLNFIPLFPGQLRGFSLVGFSAWKWQDRDASHLWELLAQQHGAMRIFQEWNEHGEPPPGSDVESVTDGTSTVHTETLDGGMNTYFRSSDPNSRVEAVKFDRPSANQQAFMAQVAREGMFAAGWSPDFALDPTKVGGASLRMLVEKLNRMVGKVQDRVIEPFVRRIDYFRIPWAMKNRKIRTVDDWWRLEYQRPPRLSSDRKYDAQVDEIRVRMGTTTRTRVAGFDGESLMDVRDINEANADDLFTRAARLAEKHKISFELALSKLEVDTPNGNMPPAKEEEDTNSTNSRESGKDKE